jgi:hypothetical protein
MCLEEQFLFVQAVLEICSHYFLPKLVLTDLIGSSDRFDRLHFLMNEGHKKSILR